MHFEVYWGDNYSGYKNEENMGERQLLPLKTTELSNKKMNLSFTQRSKNVIMIELNRR